MAHGWSADTSSVFCERKETKESSIYYEKEETILCKTGQTVEIPDACYYADCKGTATKVLIPFYGFYYAASLTNCAILGFCNKGNSFTNKSMNEVQNICSGKESCVLEAGSYWDLCPGIKMYLYVKWSCTN